MENFHEDIRSEILSQVPVESVFHKMEDFHEGIQSKILSLVPDESVLNCKLVCKRWQQLLSNRKVNLGVFFSISCSPEPFIHLFYADYDVIKSNKPEEEEEEKDDYNYRSKITQINLPPIKEDYGEKHEVLVGSCNGLVCLAIPYKGGCFYDPVYICNPLTSEYTILPRISTTNKSWDVFQKKENKSWDVVSGFGYLPSTNEYKVVRIMYPAHLGYRNPDSSTNDRKTLVQVYTLGKHSNCGGWKNITAIPPADSLFHEGIFADGSLYWKDHFNNKIVGFDLSDESFRVLPPPPCIQFPRHEKTVFRLTMLGGHLCLVDHPEGDCIDIWSFRKNKNQGGNNSYDVVEQDCYYHDWSWCKDFSIEWEQDYSFYKPLALTKNNEVLMWSLSCLKCYDPITKSMNVIIKDHPFFNTFRGVLHMNSLVSLKDFGVPSKTWDGWVSKKIQPSDEEE